MASQIPRNDLQAIADDRLIEQYRDSANLRAVIEIYISQITEVQAAAWEILDQFDVDVATGWLLDIIGAIVGLPRPAYDASLVGYFGYLTAPGAESYGSVTAPELGGVYLSAVEEVEGIYPICDSMYRHHIHAKIIRNSSSGVPDDALRIINLVIPRADTSAVYHVGEATAQVSIEVALSREEKSLFTLILNDNGDQLIPKPAGVALEFVDTAGAF